jgi:heptosyltransferase III
MKILAMRGGALGDFLITLPALLRLREQFPDSALTLLVRPAYGEFARQLGLAHEFRSLDSAEFACLFGEDTQVTSAVSDWLGQFDLILTWLADPNGTLIRHLRAHSRAEIWQGAWRVENEETPAAVQFAKVLAFVNNTVEPVADLRPFLGQIPNSNTVAVHPGSGSPRKNWPLERWAEFLEKWHETHPLHRFVIFTGEAEQEWDHKFVARINISAEHLTHLQNAPLIEAARAMSISRMFLGHDSGFGHLAAALRIPSVLLFGLTNPRVWAPRVSTTKVLVAPQGDLGNLAVEDVFQCAEYI